MGKLDDVDPAGLRRALAEAPSPKAAKRVMVALAYRDGVPVATLSERYGIPEPTVYDWLDRFAERSPEDAMVDDERPGRPPALGRDGRRALERALADPPRDHGVDASEWTPALVRSYVEREFGVTYSLGHARRLLRAAGE